MNTLSRRQQFWIFILLLAALAGLIDSTLIHLKEIAAQTNPDVFAPCSINSLINCANVAKSKYAHFAGLPVSLMGIYFYNSVLVIGLAVLLSWNIPRWFSYVISLVMIGSLLFSLRLLYYSYFGIGSLCPYCLVSDLTNALVVLAWFIFWRSYSKTTKHALS